MGLGLIPIGDAQSDRQRPDARLTRFRDSGKDVQ